VVKSIFESDSSGKQIVGKATDQLVKTFSAGQTGADTAQLRDFRKAGRFLDMLLSRPAQELARDVLQAYRSQWISRSV
jgi:hypothetical protein